MSVFMKSPFLDCRMTSVLPKREKLSVVGLQQHRTACQRHDMEDAVLRNAHHRKDGHGTDFIVAVSYVIKGVVNGNLVRAYLQQSADEERTISVFLEAGHLQLEAVEYHVLFGSLHGVVGTSPLRQLPHAVQVAVAVLFVAARHTQHGGHNC